MSDAPTPIALELDRALAAPPERVFRAWTEPAELVRWFCPGTYGILCFIPDADGPHFMSGMVAEVTVP